jgi:hypothetical protein
MMRIAAGPYDQVAAMTAQKVNELTSVEANPDCGF